MRAAMIALSVARLAFALGVRRLGNLFAIRVGQSRVLRWFRTALPAPATLALLRLRVSLVSAIWCGIRLGIGAVKLRRSASVPGLAVTPAFATTGALRIPFFHRRCP
ncbi:hypothetical protein RRU01S_10_00080 [Agrobacterium rubi TR3 = NBRC 13261]|uniref:Uncharacterized protein n=1 Tax=Agrobacterium rubi TR3 = NBRC 13261 TaxID=1368415 RepID=A0A081CU24_9HYPH|nr:hypothetical protein RRU01S_10_00080 [Agrobacterium rubi TR3 = NBRC 13261]